MSDHGRGGGSGREPTVLVVLAALVVLALGALVPIGDTTSSGGDGEAGAGEPPAAWDERLRPYVDFVAERRKLEWDHAVTAEFLPGDDFRERVTADEEPSEEEAKEIDQLEGVFRALGLVQGEFDLLGANDQAMAEGVLGFYEPERDVIVVRGDEITTEMAPVIVHELTHALQAQHFDLLREGEDSGEDLAYRTLVEADASRIENAYIATLTPAEQEAYYGSQDAQVEGQDLDGVPPFLTELLGFPYALGPIWLEAVIDARSDDAVDGLFSEPPTSEEHIALPSTFLDGDEVVDVDTPSLEDGEEEFGEAGDFGMVSLLLVLGERLPWAQAWPAVVGWEGDASITYRADDRDCIRMNVAMGDADEAAELAAAFESWIDDDDLASVSTDDELVALDSCDPGVGAGPRDVDRGEETRAFDALVLRSQIVSGLSTSFDEDVAECVADSLLLEAPGVDAVVAFDAAGPSSAEATDAQQLIVDAVDSCGGGRP